MAAELDRRKFLKLSLTALAATTLSATQIGWLITESKKPETIGVTDFQKYIVAEINKMPERYVGRVVKIENLIDPASFSPLIRGLNVNRHFKGGKYWAFLFDPDKVNNRNFRRKFVKDLAFQLRLAFRT